MGSQMSFDLRIGCYGKFRRGLSALNGRRTMEKQLVYGGVRKEQEALESEDSLLGSSCLTHQGVRHSMFSIVASYTRTCSPDESNSSGAISWLCAKRAVTRTEAH